MNVSDVKIESVLQVIILDTDHLSTLKYSDSPKFLQLAGKMADADDQDFVTTVISLEEQMRGWLARIKQAKHVSHEIMPYDELIALVEFFKLWVVLPFDERAVDRFTGFKKQKVNIGSMDLKIASIAVANDATLLTANTQHFEKIPGLMFEDWIS